MAKPKSMKLRMLVTLHALFKYSDKDHRMNSVKLNEFLRPFKLDCTARVLNDTVAVLREFGFDVRNKGEWDSQGIWIEDRPLPDEALNQLVFAVSTNPYLSNEQATQVLDALRPFVTVYQEPMLWCDVETGALEENNQMVIDAYCVIQEAIKTERRVCYTVTDIRYDKKTGEVYAEEQWETLLTPKCIYQTKGRIYVVGYNHQDQKIEAVDLQDISGIRLAYKHNYPGKDLIHQLLDKADPREYIPEERRQIIYRGPAVFKCRGQYLGELLKVFGQPSEPVIKDIRSRCTFKVDDAEIWTDTLSWIASVPDLGIRIKGPKNLVQTIKKYCVATAETILDPNIRDKHKTQMPETAGEKLESKKAFSPTDLEFFDRIAQCWADGKITYDVACAIVGCAPSTWYNYVRKRGFARKTDDA